jgi:hypothetical protein
VAEIQVRTPEVERNQSKVKAVPVTAENPRIPSLAVVPLLISGAIKEPVEVVLVVALVTGVTQIGRIHFVATAWSVTTKVVTTVMRSRETVVTASVDSSSVMSVPIREKLAKVRCLVATV